MLSLMVVIVSLVSVWTDVIEYRVLVSALLIVLVKILVEAYETLDGIVLLGLMVLTIELSVTVGLLVGLKLKSEDVRIMFVMVVDNIGVLDDTSVMPIDE